MIKKLLSCMAAATLLANPVAAQKAETYPTRAVKIVVPWAVGGISDGLARIIGDELSKRMGQAFVVENRPGAAGIIGAAYVASANPDGYTLFLTSDTNITVNPLVYDNLPSDPLENFTPVAMLSNMPMVLVTTPASNIKTLDELVSAAKAAPNPITFGTSGPGSPSALLNELFKLEAGIEMNQIPYKGNSPLVMAVLSGEITSLFATSVGIEEYIKTGKLNGIAVASTSRVPYLSDLPTLREEGFKNTQVDYWQMVLVPKGTPESVVDKLNQEINSVIQLDRVKRYIGTMGMTPLGTASPEETRARIVDEHRLWKQLNEKVNLRGN